MRVRVRFPSEAPVTADSKESAFLLRKEDLRSHELKIGVLKIYAKIIDGDPSELKQLLRDNLISRVEFILFSMFFKLLTRP